jgi:ribosomal protein S27AE
MAGAVNGPGWQELSQQVQADLAAWRQAHPRASLTAIEAATAAALQQLQARYLQDLIAASPSADLATTPPPARPRCPTCGGALEARGHQTRAVLTPGQAAPVPVTRSYAVCSACGAGHFPPG